MNYSEADADYHRCTFSSEDANKVLHQFVLGVLMAMLVLFAAAPPFGLPGFIA
jgi:hypothetical protein